MWIFAGNMPQGLKLMDVPVKGQCGAVDLTESWTHSVYMHVQHGQKGVWVAFDVIGFDGRPDIGLAKDKLGQLVQTEKLSISLE